MIAWRLIQRSAIALALGTAASTVAAQERFDIAITVDDLPVHGPLGSGQSRLSIAKDYLATLKAHGVPEAYGSVNASNVDDETTAVLVAWRNAGYPLGNHGFAHCNLDRTPTVAAWRDDVVAGEAVVARQMGRADWHYYRFPNLSAGATKERHDEAAAVLRGRGYQVAQVSVAFGSYADTYLRCVARGTRPPSPRSRFII